ncbi:prephenate dehydratase domain-containing protein [Clostridium sp. BJN0001]|uniref:prephenate dehydratase n=1 Tax=Clostridium sp. BJN0001 TaxID=2930219 RepID=UPI001FD63185|nr:prephenate dehydratase domain-containing protein [Clostridium sp. BJN0001]
MDKLAILGPKGTFSDCAAKEFLKECNLKMKKIYFSSIDDAFHSVGNECEYGIIPIENTLDGFVQRTLDLLLEMDVTILTEIKIPIKFSLMANVNKISELKKLYVQFKSSGQCRKFTDTLNGVSIITTESNMESYYKLKAGIEGDGAIVPAHICDSEISYVDKNVTDADENYTRFIIIKANKEFKWREYEDKSNIKIPLYILPKSDKPGMLFEILKGFSDNQINLVSIMSRPTKKQMGTYNFYIEIDTSSTKFEKIKATVMELNKKYKIKILGNYQVKNVL